jgi:hypothetical protein
MKMRHAGKLPDDAEKGLEMKFAQNISHHEIYMKATTTIAIDGPGGSSTATR